MLSVHGCKTKKDLKAKVGRRADSVVLETSVHGLELRPNGRFPVVGPSPYERKWYAEVTVVDGHITKVA